MSVLELQSKFFPIQPRGNFLSNEARSSTSFLSTSSEGSTEKPLSNKLKEPRELYGTTSLQHSPKWPIECQVIPEKIRHIETAPAKLEPFYVSNSAEPQPKPVGEEMGTVIYNYQPKLSVDYFCRSCVGGSDDLQVFETEANTLKFESRFESGNLAKVIKVTNVYYELYLRPDMYTDRHAQWFYFRIQNTKENVLYRFSIVNLNKPDSLYRYGLKPLMYSEKEAQLNNIGWIRCGQNISYFKNDITADENSSFYTLTFNLKFRHSNDTVYIAQCYPYTYSHLQNYLKEIEANSFKSQLLTVRLLCRSLAGNNTYIVTITSPENYLEENQNKPVVVISARVHPGETQSSFMMKGIIDFLTSDCSHAKDLRDRFIFKLIPMLNPDGVIVGNSRCCLLGQDLNRQYRTVLREAFPQIYHTKVMLRRLMDENGIFLYCDLHGHSRRNNVFIYGCENRRVPEKRLIEQVFPLMMHKNATDKFSFQNCKFKIQRNKEGTGRVFVWTLGVVNSYTLEISLGGSTMSSRHFTHFSIADYEAIGRHFCETLLDFSDTNPIKEKLRDKILQKLLEGGSNADDPVNVPITDYSRKYSLSHSETEESEDEEEKSESKPQITLKRQQSIRNSKKKLKPKSTTADRPAMSLSKTSVEFIRVAQKHKKVDEATGESSKEQMSSSKRLTKFRRRSRPGEPSLMQEKESTVMQFSSLPKCTSLLFDDPFNPPDFSSSQKKGFEICEDEEFRLHSQTEDECDGSDGAFPNQNFLVNSAITETDLTEELATLQLTPHTTKLETQDISTVERSIEAVPLAVYTPTKPTKTMTPVVDETLYEISYRFAERRSVNLKKQQTVTERKGSVGVNPVRSRAQNFTNEASNSRMSTVSGARAASVAQRRVSWTGVQTNTTTTQISVPSSSNSTNCSAGPVTNSSSISPSVLNNYCKRKTLKKSKSMGDKTEPNQIRGISTGENTTNSNRKRKSKLKRSKK